MDQTYPNIEITIVDDSKKNRKTQIKEWMKKYEKSYERSLLYIHNGIRVGGNRARNQGFRESNGSFKEPLDDDDLWYNDKTSLQVEFLLKHPSFPLVVCYSNDLRFNMSRISKPPNIINHKMILKSFNLSSTSSYMLRDYPLQLLKKQDGSIFDENLVSGQEYDLAIRLTEHHDAGCIPKVLMIQDTSDEQISHNWNKKITGMMQLIQKHKWRYQKLGIMENLFFMVKTVGVLSMFAGAYVVGDRVYKVLTPAKKVYEAGGL